MNILSLYEGGFSLDELLPPETSKRGARRRARTRADLLAAARRIFAARGFHETTIADITAAADMAVGTFYLYFTDKQEVLAVLMQEGIDALSVQIGEAVTGVSLDRLIPISLHAIFRFAYAERDLFVIALAGGPLFGVGKRARLDLADYLTTVLSTTAARGLLDGYEIPLLARMMTGIVFQSIGWWFEHDAPGPEEMTMHVLRLLRQGLPPALLGDIDLPSRYPGDIATSQE